MLRKLSRRARDQRGQAQLGLLGVITIAALAAVVSTSMFVAVGSAKPYTPAGAAKALLRSAEGTANHLAGLNAGSYKRVGPINLRKLGLIRDQPSSTSPWVSSASGTANSYSVTVVAEPGGQMFTLHRSASGKVSIS
jgi:hypothetical protein